MSTRGLRRAILAISPLLCLLLILTLSKFRPPPGYSSSLRNKVNDLLWDPNSPASFENPKNLAPINETHQVISSLSTPDGRYFLIKFGDLTTFNPSIIPHPSFQDTYIIVAQKRRVNPDGTEPSDKSVFHVEVSCTARFLPHSDDPSNPGSGSSIKSLECFAHPEILPISATAGTKCTGPLSYLGWNVGPHDARVFWGPKKPYIIFGSNSVHTCFGMFLQDFRVLVDWKPDVFGAQETFRLATELERPGKWGFVEKNWFVWWDRDGALYGHFDMLSGETGGRVFARLDGTGAVGRDLGVLVGSGSTAAEDESGEVAVRDTSNGGKGKNKKKTEKKNKDVLCMEQYLPRLAKGKPEDIHQATNSLRVTLCNRRKGRISERGDIGHIHGDGKAEEEEDENGEGEEECVPDSENTVIMTIVHHKTFYDYHGQYEPYVVLFRQRRPFELYGISKKPLWISGRERQSTRRSDMFYVASANWKGRGLGYHGFLDDVVFLGFGIEDHASGGMDLTMGELLSGIGLCSD